MLNKTGKKLSLSMAIILACPFFMMSQPSVTSKVIEPSVNSYLLNFRIVQVVEGLEHPWAIAWLPDGRMLITERPGRMHIVDDNSVTELKNLPPIHYQADQRTAPQGGSQAGLLDVAVHPDFEDNGWIYFTYSSPGDADGVSGVRHATGTGLARAQLNANATNLTDLEVIYTMQPRTQPGRHYGSRIVFPGDGTVIFSIGDRGMRGPSQDLSHPAGSMIRLLEDGGAAPDNPFIGMAPGNIRPEIFSFGHRNNQGIAINPANGQIWATDHGPRGGDLLYRIGKGNNYGWPQVSFGVEYSTGEKVGIGREAPGVTPPDFVWEDSMGPSGLTFVSAAPFAPWNGNILAGSLLRQEIYRMKIHDTGQVTLEETLISRKIGRVRDVREGPDGFIYIATDEGNGGIYRLEPVN